MNKQETIEKILWVNTKMRTMKGGINESVIGAGTIPTLAQEIEEALFPVGGHHDHMCPCGRDWETNNEITRRILLKIIRDCYGAVGQYQSMPIRWFADYSMKWLDEEKING